LPFYKQYLPHLKNMKTSYNYAIIDDNPIDIKIVESNLSKLPHLKLVKTFNSPIEAIPTIQEGLD
jgi:hypothetical protein